MSLSRRNFLKMSGTLAGSALIPGVVAQTGAAGQMSTTPQAEGATDYTIRNGATPIESWRCALK